VFGPGGDGLSEVGHAGELISIASLI
jgi:hypothetical protein